MTFEAYEAVVDDSGYEARGRERQALSLGIDRLERLQKGRASFEDQVQSLLYVRRLWTIFIEDLAHPENGLPEKLRADMEIGPNNYQHFVYVLVRELARFKATYYGPTDVPKDVWHAAEDVRRCIEQMSPGTLPQPIVEE